MFFEENEYLLFLKNPKQYLEYELELVEYRYNHEKKIEYPLCMLGDIKLYFNHYPSFEEAQKKWNQRKQRINWDNLFVAMYTSSEKIAEEFSELSYKKKICFTSFESDIESTLYVDLCEKLPEKPFYTFVNGMANGIYTRYNAVDLLLNGTVNFSRIEY